MYQQKLGVGKASGNQRHESKGTREVNKDLKTQQKKQIETLEKHPLQDTTWKTEKNEKHQRTLQNIRKKKTQKNKMKETIHQSCLKETFGCQDSLRFRCEHLWNITLCQNLFGLLGLLWIEWLQFFFFGGGKSKPWKGVWIVSYTLFLGGVLWFLVVFESLDSSF